MESLREWIKVLIVFVFIKIVITSISFPSFFLFAKQNINTEPVKNETLDKKNKKVQDERVLSIIKRIKENEAILMEREKKLEIEEERLKLLRKEVEKKIEDLASLKTETEALLKKVKEIENERVSHLVGVISAMRPKDAASLIENMDEEVAVNILLKMNERIAGRILSNVDPKKAVKLTQKMAKLRSNK